ncbi:MAG: uroporphyrinogen decarboxylase family protein [bacterium]
MQLSSDLRKIDNWFLDHLMYPDKLEALLDVITKARLQMIEKYHEAGIDGVVTWDDMGTNLDTLVGPGEFRQLYLPRYKKTIDELHNRGMHFIHHCCGKVNKFMDMFVEAGTDVLQLDQPTLMGIDFLSENYGGKICFWSCVDIQTTMQEGTNEDIRKQAHELVYKLGKFNGGFMVKTYESPEAVNITEEKFVTQYNAFLEVADYPLKEA